jgi:hypothetical protein
MKVIVFVGPTISRTEAAEELAAVYRPPATMGDVLRAALEEPLAIGLIDGYFEHTPAVWHKEILFAMARGIHVFGAASMGALRAAELAPFGMEGVGAIYDAYAKQELDGDDEVAVAHAMADDSFRSLSEALVNIRATVNAAESAGVVSTETARRLVALAKGMFYPDRAYPALLSRAAAVGVPEPEVVAFRDFLRRGQINQKRLDAMAMLQLMRSRVGPDLQPKRVRYHFEHTDAWAHMLASLGIEEVGSGAAEP